jgi:hypothetical protein
LKDYSNPDAAEVVGIDLMAADIAAKTGRNIKT